MRIRKDCLAGMLVAKKNSWIVPCNKKDKPIGILGLGNFIFSGQFFTSADGIVISKYGEIKNKLHI